MTRRGGLSSGLWIHPDDPWGKVHRLSGGNYVSMRLNEDELGWGFQSTPIRTPGRCEHGYTACIECIDSWCLDYEVNWGSTGGGRRLRDEVLARYATDPDAPDVRGVPRPVDAPNS